MSGSLWLVSESLAACGRGQAPTSIVPPDIQSSSAELQAFKQWWNQNQSLAQRCVDSDLYHTQDFICPVDLVCICYLLLVLGEQRNPERGKKKKWQIIEAAFCFLPVHLSCFLVVRFVICTKVLLRQRIAHGLFSALCNFQGVSHIRGVT